MIKADPQDEAAPSFCLRGPPENVHLAKQCVLFLLLGGSQPKSLLGTIQSSSLFTTPVKLAGKIMFKKCDCGVLCLCPPAPIIFIGLLATPQP